MTDRKKRSTDATPLSPVSGTDTGSSPSAALDWSRPLADRLPKKAANLARGQSPSWDDLFYTTLLRPWLGLGSGQGQGFSPRVTGCCPERQTRGLKNEKKIIKSTD